VLGARTWSDHESYFTGRAELWRSTAPLGVATSDVVATTSSHGRTGTELSLREGSETSLQDTNNNAWPANNVIPAEVSEAQHVYQQKLLDEIVPENNRQKLGEAYLPANDNTGAITKRRAARIFRKSLQLTITIQGTKSSSTPTIFIPDHTQVAHRTETHRARPHGFNGGQIGNGMIKMVAMLMIQSGP